MIKLRLKKYLMKIKMWFQMVRLKKKNYHLKPKNN